MADLIRRYPLISYFVIAYAGTWLVWALSCSPGTEAGLLPFHSPLRFLLIGIGTFSGPTVSAFVVTAVTEGMNPVPYLASLGNEIVIRIDHQKCSELLVVCHFHHGLSPTIVCRWHPMTLGIRVRNG